MAPIGEAGKHTSIAMNLINHGSGLPVPVEIPLHSGGCSPAEVIVHVVGDIDICTEPALRRCLDAQLQPARHLTSLVVDLSAVAFVGVRGFAALLDAATNAHHREVAFCLTGCGPQVLRLLAVLDPNRTLTVRADSGTPATAAVPIVGLDPGPAPLGDQEPAAAAANGPWAAEESLTA